MVEDFSSIWSKQDPWFSAQQKKCEKVVGVSDVDCVYNVQLNLDNGFIEMHHAQYLGINKTI